MGLPAHASRRGVHGRDPQSPQGAPPPVLQRGRIAPPPVGSHPVVARSVVLDRSQREVEVVLQQLTQPGVGCRFAAGDQECAGHVVEAVAVLRPRLGEQRVLEQPVSARQPAQVVEHRPGDHGGETHAATRALTSSRASDR